MGLPPDMVMSALDRMYWRDFGEPVRGIFSFPLRSLEATVRLAREVGEKRATFMIQGNSIRHMDMNRQWIVVDE